MDKRGVDKARGEAEELWARYKGNTILHILSGFLFENEMRKERQVKILKVFLSAVFSFFLLLWIEEQMCGDAAWEKQVRQPERHEEPLCKTDTKETLKWNEITDQIFKSIYSQKY